MNMKSGVPYLLVIGVLAVLILFGRNSATTAAISPTAPAPQYEYKVELVKHNADLEGVLQTNAGKGWRVREVVIGPFHNELVVVLEKGGSNP